MLPFKTSFSNASEDDKDADLHEEVLLRIDTSTRRQDAHLNDLKRLNAAANASSSSTRLPVSSHSSAASGKDPRFQNMRRSLFSFPRNAKNIVLSISVQNVILWNPSPDPMHPNYAFTEHSLTHLLTLLTHPRYIVHLMAVTTSNPETRQILSLLRTSGLFKAGLDPRRVLFFADEHAKCEAVVSLGSVVHVDSVDASVVRLAGIVPHVVRVGRRPGIGSLGAAVASTLDASHVSSSCGHSACLSPVAASPTDTTSADASTPTSSPIPIPGTSHHNNRTTSITSTSTSITAFSTDTASHRHSLPASTPLSPPPQFKLKPLLVAEGSPVAMATTTTSLRRRTSSISSLSTMIASSSVGGVAMSRTGSANSAATTWVGEVGGEGTGSLGGRGEWGKGGLFGGVSFPGNVRVVEVFGECGLLD
ncbi:hypothetical protein HDU67_000516 [Dinochytrium kinnereticum]|nr:hypothetical protein HDU67_000516 [Dinochytrium kinnereticum]